MKIRGVRFRGGLLAAMAGVLCLAPALFASDGTRRGNPHAHFQNPDQCPKCHLTQGSQPVPGRFSIDADTVCLECHAKDSLGRFHPVNVRPGRQVPEDEGAGRSPAG